MGNGVAAVVPHILVGAGKETVYAKLIYKGLAGGVEAVVGGNGGEIRYFGYAVIYDGIIVGSFYADHCLEQIKTERLALLLGKGGGVKVVLGAHSLKLFLSLGGLFLGSVVSIGGGGSVTGGIGIIITGALYHFYGH